MRNIVKSAGGTANMQASALLHDTPEDTATTEQDILDEFGPAIAKLVVELTDAQIQKMANSYNTQSNRQRQTSRC